MFKRQTVKKPRLLLWLTAYWVVTIICTGTMVYAVETLTGIYTIQGQKGAITLKLSQNAQGGVEGTLKGGDLSLKLTGFPREGGGMLGTAQTDAGAFASYFQVVKQGTKVLFDLVPANEDGDPDLTKANRITFPATGSTAPAAQEQDEEPQGADMGEADTEEPGDEVDEEAAPADDTAEETPKPSAPAGGFTGTWKGEGLTMESRAQGNDYTGTLTLNNQKMPFTASSVNGLLHGAFQSGQDRYDFQGKMQGGALVLSSGDTTYRLQKQGAKPNPLAKPNNPLAKTNPAKPANPLANKSPAKPSATTKAATKPTSVVRPAGAPKGGAAWKTFKHPVGLSLRYPPTWTAKDLGGVLQLLPPDVKQIGGGPAEVFLVMANAAGPIRSASDPQMEQYIEQQAAQLLAGFTRSGAAKPIKAGNEPGLLMTWEGLAQGTPARAQVYATVLKNFGVAFLVISAKDQIKASRDHTVQQIFGSLAAGAGEKDPQVVGKWFLYSYKSSGGYGRETKSYMTLLPDGTALWGQQSESGGNFSGRDAGGNTTWTGGVASQGNSSDGGSWSAGKGQLIIAWGDGTMATWQYRVGGSPGGNRRLFLTGSKDKPDEWMEVR